MIPPYTIRRRISDSKWEYLKGENSRYGYKFRCFTKEKAEKRLALLPVGEGWEISCCGA